MSSFQKKIRLPAVALLVAVVAFCAAKAECPPPPSDVSIGKLERDGAFGAEDSLLEAADSCRPLPVNRLLQWAHARELQGKLSGAAAVYCRVLQSDPHQFGPITGRLSQVLEPAPEDSIAAALGVLRRALALPGVDTLPMQYWMADFYRRHGLDSLEHDLLLSVPATISRLLPRFEEEARLTFSLGLFTKAIPPARAVYDHARDRRMQAAAADLLSRSFMALHRDDSALVWLLRAGISGDKGKIDAATLFQANGRLDEAQAVIATLAPTSFCRDTLELRQRLFSRNSATAPALIDKEAAGWGLHPDDRLLWTSRVLLFGGSVDRLSALLDTAPVTSTAYGASELLSLRLVLQRYKGEDAWLADWCAVQYAIFLGKPMSAYGRISGARYAPELKDALLLCIARNLVERGSPEVALRILEQQGDSAAPPEYLYSHAELLRRSLPEKAEKLLLSIIRDNPGSVYSEKARVLLAGIRKRPEPE